MREIWPMTTNIVFFSGTTPKMLLKSFMIYKTEILIPSEHRIQQGQKGKTKTANARIIEYRLQGYGNYYFLRRTIKVLLNR